MASDLTGRAVVLGLDGATWDLLVPLAERGIMLTLARALEQGRHGRLQSCLPPYSSPAWMSISTGKNPGSHGIFDFWEAGLPGERRLVSSRSAKGKKLWELVDVAGRVAHVVAVPDDGDRCRHAGDPPSWRPGLLQLLSQAIRGPRRRPPGRSLRPARRRQVRADDRHDALHHRRTSSRARLAARRISATTRSTSSATRGGRSWPSSTTGLIPSTWRASRWRARRSTSRPGSGMRRRLVRHAVRLGAARDPDARGRRRSSMRPTIRPRSSDSTGSTYGGIPCRRTWTA